jgi:hypothetical protein
MERRKHFHSIFLQFLVVWLHTAAWSEAFTTGVTEDKSASFNRDTNNKF